MKKIFILTILVITITCLLAISVSAAQFGSVTTIDGFTTVEGLDTTARVLMDDGITYPSAYIFKNLRDTSFDALNTATGKSYTAANVVMLEYPEGCTYADGALSQSTTLEYVYFSSTITGFRWAAFGNCSNLSVVEFAENSTVTAINTDAFHDTAITTLKLPNSLQTIGENFIRNCKSLETIYFGASFTQVFNRNALLAGCSNIKTIYMPEGVFDENGDIALNHKFFGWNDRDNQNFKNGGVIYYTGSQAKAQKIVDGQRALYQSNYSSASDYNTAVWWIINLVSLEQYEALTPEQKSSACYMVYEYNLCDAFYNGKHDVGDVNTCCEDATCQREKCALVIKSTFTDHKLNESLVYANGFDNAGVYNCYCENASYCTVANANEETAPIVTFKGYSVPETAGVKGINAGFKVDKDLLEDYNDINDVDATLTLFMVNCKSDEVNISKIFKDGTLDLETGVKGINVAITSTSYTNISVEVKGFDDSSVTGNYYTLKLITAIAVKTEEGTHFVQAGLKTGNDKQAVDGVDFNIVSAENVYNAVAE